MSLERTLQCPSVGKSGSRVPFGPFQTRSVAKASFSPAPPPPAAPVRTDDRGVMPGKPLLAPSSDPSPSGHPNHEYVERSLVWPHHVTVEIRCICGYVGTSKVRLVVSLIRHTNWINFWKFGAM